MQRRNGWGGEARAQDRRRGRHIGSAAALGAAALLAGCGGQDFGSFSRSLSGDIGSGFNSPLSGRGRSDIGSQAAAERGVYPRIETGFQIANPPGDPFDYEKVRVLVVLRKPDGNVVEVPAFFDGGTTWRMRYTPSAPGAYAVTGVRMNGEPAREEKLEKREWNVTGTPSPGFVRIDRGDHARFVFDNGARFLPLGHNVAWRNGSSPDIPDIFARMHASGENWARVWMNHWDGKNLDWPRTGRPARPGEIDLQVARRWDTLVDAAEKEGISFQMVLQHHGQYSSKSGHKFSGNVNPNWETNPYNADNGGFLRSPEEFFTSPQARALTRRKLYYILARWGCSPAIMAFELFNEVEFTDAGRGKLWDDIAMWHREMALFLRQYDGYRHLLTTSAAPNVPPDSPIWETVDYLQTHTYPPDVLSALSAPPAGGGRKLSKPAFIGEFGPDGTGSRQVDRNAVQIALHTGLWAGLMSGASGAPQFWDWDAVEKYDLYGIYKAASAFLLASGLANHGGLVAAAVPVETPARAALRFAPGGGWVSAPTRSEFVVGAEGAPPGMEQYPSFLQGTAHREMTPKPLTLQIHAPQTCSIAVTVARVARAGARLRLSVDGKTVERNYPAGERDYAPEDAQATLSLDAVAGAHTVTLENTGADWAQLRHFTLTNYAPALAGRARIGKDYAVAWIYNRSGVDAPADREQGLSGVSGQVRLPGMQAGNYRASWWDTRMGRPLESVEVTVRRPTEGAVLTTPSLTRDVALVLAKAVKPGPTKSPARLTTGAK